MCTVCWLGLLSLVSGRTWLTVFHCDGGQGSSIVHSDWKSIASKASGVRICTHGSSTDCVTSVEGRAPSEALTNIRAGKPTGSMLQSDAKNCDIHCIQGMWTGSAERLGALTWSDMNGDCMYYHACDNGVGLHFGRIGAPESNGHACSDTHCQWSHAQHGSSKIDIQLLVPDSLAKYEQDQGIGQGTTFLIILFSAITLYCISGVLYNYQLGTAASLKDTVPHKTFWCDTLPSYTLAGVAYTQQVVKSACVGTQTTVATEDEVL